ncbi:MAG: hypothetical protein U1G07_24745 [Verrucomicrobiota bacterium]
MPLPTGARRATPLFDGKVADIRIATNPAIQPGLIVGVGTKHQVETL